MPVYFIQEGQGGAIKIGMTAGSPHARLRDLQTGNSRKLELLAVIDGGAAEEASLHQRFAAHRIQGEWFDPDPRLLGFVEGLLYAAPRAAPTVVTEPAFGFSTEQIGFLHGIAEGMSLVRRIESAGEIAHFSRGVMDPMEVLSVERVLSEHLYCAEPSVHDTPFDVGKRSALRRASTCAMEDMIAAVDSHNMAIAESRLAQEVESPDALGDGVDLGPLADDVPTAHEEVH